MKLNIAKSKGVFACEKVIYRPALGPTSEITMPAIRRPQNNPQKQLNFSPTFSISSILGTTKAWLDLVVINRQND